MHSHNVRSLQTYSVGDLAVITSVEQFSSQIFTCNVKLAQQSLQLNLLIPKLQHESRWFNSLVCRKTKPSKGLKIYCLRGERDGLLQEKFASPVSSTSDSFVLLGCFVILPLRNAIWRVI